MFKKGQEVTVIRSWDNKGTFYITQGEVYSCGKKQMVINARGNPEKCLGRNFRPNSEQYGHGHNSEWVFPVLTNEEAEAKALELGAEHIVHEIARIRGLIERQPNASPAYLNGLREDIAKLEAATPAFLYRD